MRQNDPEASYPARTGTRARVPAATTAVARERRRAFKRLRLHRQFVPLLVLITLLSTVGIAGMAYIGSRAAAISNAQSRAAQDARVVREELTARGVPLLISDGRMVVGTGANALTLNNDTTVVDHARVLLGDDSTIYEREGSRLVAISTNLPVAGAPHGSRDLGDALPANITAAVLNSCGPAAPSTCYHAYDGLTTLAGRQYVVDVVPLFDATGAFVGAVGAALPLDAILASTVQLTVALLLVGALLALVSLACGTWIYGARVEAVLGRLDGRLNQLADTAGDLEHLSYRQAEHAARQSVLARQIAEQVRALDVMAQVMEQGHAALRDSTTEMWAEISQPGGAPDITTAARLAQQTAVAAARVGSSAEDARILCRQLVTQMNHIVAEAGIVTDGGQAMEQCAQDLRAGVEGVEITLGERLRKRMLGSSLPLIRRARAASQHLRRLLPTRTGFPGKNPAGTLTAPREGAQQQTSVDPAFGSRLSSTGRHVAAPRTSGTLRANNQFPTSSGNPPWPPHSPRSPRFSSDAASSNSGWRPGHPRTSGWLDE